MPDRSVDRTAVILLAMGGPDNLAGVKQYLFNIFSDRSIIRLPGGPTLQKPFAWLIARLRYKKVQHHYSLIGGGSPLLKWTLAQKDHLERLLEDVAPGTRCYVGMRYYTPTISQAIVQAYQDGCGSMIFLPLYPHYCRATVGSTFEEAARGLKRAGKVTPTFIKDFHDHPRYITLLRRYICDNMRPGETLLFSAHSIPQKLVEEGDPYVEQVKKTAYLAADGRQYNLSFQSRTGPVRWVGPDTVPETTRLLRESPGGLFIVPISFVCDHIETLYEIDIELRSRATETEGARIRRMPMFNDDPEFAAVLVDLVIERLALRVE